MDFKQLKALVTIADTANMTRASEVLNIVQPALSRQIKLLEDELGTVLFMRGRQGMILNEEGKTFLEYARRILQEAEKAKAEISPSAETVNGLVNVGLLPSTSDLLSSMLIRNLQQSYPGIKVTITSGYAGHLQDWLEVGEIDVALLYDTKLNSALSVQPLVEEKLWLVGPASSDLKVEQPVELSDMSDKPFILPSRPHGLRILVEQVSQKYDMRLNVVAETNSMSVQKRLVLDGLGYTILPSIAITEDLARGQLKASPLSDSGLVRTIVLAHAKSRNMTKSVRCVMNELSDCIQKCVRSGNWKQANWIHAGNA